MPETVRLNNELKLIHIKSTEVVTEGDLKQSLSEILELKRKSKFNKIYVDHSDATYFPKPVPSFNFGTDISRILKGASIAMVSSPSAQDSVEFFKNVVNARDGNVKIFTSESSALQWLSIQAD